MTDEDGYEDDPGLRRRFERNTYIFTLLALIVGWIWSGWRMALGVLLGAALCLFNKRWLEGSLRAMLNHAVARETGRVPPFTVFKFILRYFVIALVIGAAVWMGWFHPLGIGIGFAALVGGVMIETAYQLYLATKSQQNSSQE
jgi:hypothetical protein